MTIADSKKEREKVLSHYRELAAEKKEFADKVDRRVTVSQYLHHHYYITITMPLFFSYIAQNFHHTR